MKISQMDTNQVLDVLSVAAAELEPMLADKKLMGIEAFVTPKKNESNLEYGMRVARKLISVVPMFSKDYRQGIYRILAAFFQCTPEEVGKKPFIENWKQIKDCFDDEEFLSFFPWLAQSAQKESSAT